MRSHAHRRLSSNRLWFVRLSRVEHHQADPDTDIANCGLCGDMVWMSTQAEMFMAMNPTVPMLCCGCADLSVSLLRQAFPNTNFYRKDIPDLARQGVFN